LCFDFLYKFVLKKKVVLGTTEGDVIKNMYWSSCKVVVISCQILTKLEFLENILQKKILKYQISGKFHPVGAKLFRADGQIYRQDPTKLTVVFLNFANASKKKNNSQAVPMRASQSSSVPSRLVAAR